MTTAYLTSPRSAAGRLANELVDEGLAACVNRIPCLSTYEWEGQRCEDEETILIAKTTPERYPDLVEHVRASHPHEVPCIERFDEDDVLGSYADWVKEQTAA